MPKKPIRLACLLLLLLSAACTPAARTTAPTAPAATQSVTAEPAASPSPATGEAQATLALVVTPQPSPADAPGLSDQAPPPLAVTAEAGIAEAANPTAEASPTQPGTGGFAPAGSVTPVPIASSAAPEATQATGRSALTAPAGGSGTSGIPAFSHIFVIVMENREATAIVDNPQAPFMNKLAGEYARAANYYGISHPSLPNYLALTGGDTFGVNSDCTDCTINAENLVDQLEQAHHTWKAYMEAMPRPCSPATATGTYAKKHNPFVYYDDIRTNPERCNNIVPLTQLQTDFQNNTVPDFVWITPDMCNDMHDCPVTTGDAWLQKWVTAIMASPAWQNNGALFITFDEGSSRASCCEDAHGGRVDTLVVSPLSRRGFVSQTPYSHYALLRTIEDAWGMQALRNAGGKGAAPMADFFVKP